MATTRTPGITVAADGRVFVDKRYRGIRIGMRLGVVAVGQAEERLQRKMARIDEDLAAREVARPTFHDCAQRYLAQSQDLRSLEAVRIHLRLLESYIGHLEPRQVHDATLAPFVSARIAAGVSATTINRTLETARTVLHRAARSYRDAEGKPWLDALPPLLTFLPEHRRPPYPITSDEQDRLFPRLPGHLGRMALFAVNTGLRDSNDCGSQWKWEVPVPAIRRNVFLIPADAIKSKRAHVVVLNDTAWSIVQSQRGLHPMHVFSYRGRPGGKMNNTAWQRARREVGLKNVRVHDLRHPFGCRLRAAGVSAEDRAALLRHSTQTMFGHYASADLGILLRLSNRILNRAETCTVLRVANG